MARAKISNLRSAKKAKNDEFYTQIYDIENELKHYKKHFKDKVIFLNCDDPEKSNFWKYFEMNFEDLGVKKVIATHYDREKPTYKLEMTGLNQWVKTDLEQNGDFRSPECIELLKEADIVVTNPPFSLFREYVAQLMEYNKKFIIMGNINALTYKEIFPLVKDKRLWTGFAFNKTMKFAMPESYTTKNEERDNQGRKIGKVPSITWYTNLEHKKRHESLIRDLYKEYSPGEFPKYDNYDAINVDKVADIPKDYFGVMGVPITFIDKYNPDEFEILGITDRQNTSGLRTKKYTREDSPKYNDLNVGSVLIINGEYKRMYARLIIKRKVNED